MKVSTYDQVKELIDAVGIKYFMETVGNVLNDRKIEETRPAQYHSTFNGKQIKLRRKLLKTTQVALAELSGVSLRTIKAVENNMGNPTVEILNKILEPIGMTLCTKERV
jgi:putative transcriptional regulator